MGGIKRCPDAAHRIDFVHPPPAATNFDWHFLPWCYRFDEIFSLAALRISVFSIAGKLKQSSESLTRIVHDGSSFPTFPLPYSDGHAYELSNGCDQSEKA